MNNEEELKECPICGSDNHTDGRCETDKSPEDYYENR